MLLKNRHCQILGVIAATTVVVGYQPTIAREAALRVTTIASPARGTSHEPNLCALSDGRVAMSWLEAREPSGLSLRFAVYDGTRWSPATTIAEGDSFFANWADFPSIRSLAGGRLVAHWLWKSGVGTYSYDVRLSQSEDGGRTWGPPVIPHRDGTATEHGFVSLVPDDAGVLAVWLDGRNGAGHSEKAASTPDMTVRAAVVTHRGAIEREALLDARACDCCQTAAVRTSRGILVAYRDRSAEEVRDISLTRYDGGRWSEPYRLHADGWEINACPVNGPALDSRGAQVVAAWYTGAPKDGEVRVAFSNDGGVTFGPPVRIDDGHPMGRVHVVLDPDGRALVVWLENDGKEARIRARHVGPRGTRGGGVTLATTSAARASGFPRLVRTSRTSLLAWTDSGKERQVRVLQLSP